MLDMIVLDSDAVARLAGGLSSISSQFAYQRLFDDDGAVDPTILYDIAVAYWDVLYILRDREIEVGDDERFFFDVAIHIAEAYIGTLALSPAKALAVDVGMPVIVDQLEHWGIIPPDGAAVRANADLMMEQRAMETAGAIVVVGVGQLVQQGLLAPEAVTGFSFRDPGSKGCRPAEFHRQLREHILALGLDEHAENALLLTLETFLNHQGTLGMCDRG
jgi:hypothetical protein